MKIPLFSPFKACILHLFFLFLSLCLSVSVFGQNVANDIQEEKHFDGFNVGIALGSQNIFGGAFIDELDVLAQKSGFVVDFSVGFRKQIIQRKAVIGATFFYGLTSGDLQETDPRNQISIDYQNSTQVGFGLQLGGVIGEKEKVLLYLLAQQSRRVFDIELTSTDGMKYQQEDTQNFEKYGVGVEFPVYKKINVLVNVAKISVDFHDLEVSMDVEDKLDFNVGLLINF